ncbi:MAG: hypothetical protein ABR875_01210 [Minisyncoccia bacterium]|jgi:hypothetical protein
MLKRAVAVLLFCLLAPVAWAQNAQQNDKPHGVILGFKFKGGYAPNPWRITSYSNFPEVLRTVQYPSGYLSIYAIDRIKLHSGMIMIPGEFGPTLNFGNRLELAAGGMIIFNGDHSNEVQYGCYCIGSTVTYFELKSSPVRLGAFGETSVRLGGRFWLTSEAYTSFPFWMNVSLRQGYSEYGGDETLLKKQVAYYRVPMTLLGGFKICVSDCDTKEGRGMLGFSGGLAFRRNYADANIVGLQYPSNQQLPIIQVFLEYNFLKK